MKNILKVIKQALVFASRFIGGLTPIFYVAHGLNRGKGGNPMKKLFFSVFSVPLLVK